mgnify:CR=1 FL=1
MSEEKTIFQKIIDKEIPSTTHYEDDLCIVIEDINPKAPIHLLIIPKKPIPKLSDASEEDISSSEASDNFGIGFFGIISKCIGALGFISSITIHKSSS